MSPAEKRSLPQPTGSTFISRLPRAAHEAVSNSKYAAAVSLYASSSKTIREIAAETGLTEKALSRYLSKHHRSLLYMRYGIVMPAADTSVKIRPARGQSLATHLKYKDAIEAAGDIAYIESNISQIARLFNVDPTGLSSQLRVHYPDVLPAREALRKKLGIADRLHRGALPASKAAYEAAVPVYKESDLTIKEVADKFGISSSGFGQYMRFYHHDVITAKAARRHEAKKIYYQRQSGSLSGNGQLYGPKQTTDALYAPAMKLYREGRKTLEEVIKETGVPADGFTHYLDKWNHSLRRSRKEGKYGEAIASLKEQPRPVTEVAKEFGLNADVFREYLKKHAPDLAESQGMVRLENGKLIKRSAWEKYRPAIEEYHKEGGSLRQIALRHGLKYPSLFSFLKRLE